jgi:hypothetical protein
LPSDFWTRSLIATRVEKMASVILATKLSLRPKETKEREKFLKKSNYQQIQNLIETNSNKLDSRD